MIRHFIVIGLMFLASLLYGQKKSIDSEAYRNWQSLDGIPKMSNDGKFLAYGISYGLDNDKQEHVIASTEKDWKLNIYSPLSDIKFTSNSENCLFLTSRGYLKILNLNSRKQDSIADVSWFAIPEYGSGEWLVYKNNKRTLSLKSLRTGKEVVFDAEGMISPDGKVLLLTKYSKNMVDDYQSIEWLNLETNKSVPIWSGKNMNNLIADFKNQQLAFKVESDILYYKIGMKTPVNLIKTKGSHLACTLKIGSLDGFSRLGDRLLVGLNEYQVPISRITKNAPEIWSYTDPKLQTVQEKELYGGQNSYLASIRLKDHELIRIQNSPDEYFLSNKYDNIILSNYLSGEGDYREANWNTYSKRNFDLIIPASGERIHLDFLSQEGILNEGLSPGGKYIVFYDRKEESYYSYDVESAEKHHLTKGLETSWMRVESNPKGLLRGVAGWLSNDKEVLIYDSHDIWKFDLAGKRTPVCLTNRFGLKNDIVFNLSLSEENKTINKTKPMVIAAFSIVDKKNGFFNMNLNESENPVKLTMDDCIYQVNSINVLQVSDFIPIKARNADVYLVRRQSVAESPNYYCTENFKTFRKLTDFYPQKDYNWYSSELHTWDAPDGSKIQGILYKPENFDLNGKYPVIFYYYQKLSDGLNAYMKPQFSEGGIDIPTYVSNGYLVFCMDINYEMGDPMQGTYNAIVSAAKYLSKFPFVDSSKLGLQGFSFGGVQTNYLITRTNLFAAACSGSGLGDWISAYGSLTGNEKDGYGESCAVNFENEGQLRMGRTVWENLPGYLKSSPIFHIDNVTTPIFFMHTKNDTVCPYSNIMELFLGLRRLGKKSWMAVYSLGNHTLFGKESEDFTIRMRQFFDHYLMNKAAPIWMLDGVPAKDRIMGAGLDLDTLGRKPLEGLLNTREQVLINSMVERAPSVIKVK